MTQERVGRVAGVDGYKNGWVGVHLSGGAVERVTVNRKVADLVAELEPLDVVGIDIPIGLSAEGHRDADLRARTFLEKQRSSVFLTPPRGALGAEKYEDASPLARALGAGGVTRQAFALFPRIREVDALKDDARLVEVHPEVSFRRLKGTGLPPKRTWNGLVIRRRLLTDAGIVLPDAIDAVGDLAEAHDVLDAAVAAWSAARYARGEAVPLPDTTTEHDGTRPIAIWS